MKDIPRMVATLLCITIAICDLQQGSKPANGLLSLQANLSTSNKSYDVPDDCYYAATSPGSEEIALTCNLRSINSEFDRTNFSVIPSEETVALHVICNGEIRVKSTLEPKSFVHLAKVKELSIEYCKIAKFNQDILYGLAEIRNFTLRTHNINWPTLNLNIEIDSFAATEHLERLDLSKNNIWSLPENVFCHLSELSFLNISENRLQDINDLGLRDKQLTNTTNATICSLDLDTLDVSFNHFVLLPTNGFGILRRLKVLRLNNNEISMIADKALNGLKSLQILNLSSNKIVALPSELFADQTQHIQEIYLQNNSISVLSPNLFAGLEQLQALDLSYNQISSTWINPNTFGGLIRLVLLNLSHNKISRLASTIFSDLYTLQIFNLRYNQLETIEDGTFSPMSNLHTLLLSHNRLTFLDAHALNGLYVLSLLSLDNNLLADVHQDAFRNCSSLQDLNLNGNKLKTIPRALKGMRLLRTIDLGENIISTLNESPFDSLQNLYGLRLIENQLENITLNAFTNLQSLQILNLARNRIKSVETGSFEVVSSIQAIRLDGNYLEDVQGLFSKMPSLLWLNISDNKLSSFDLSYIPNTLQWLDLHKNDLSEISNHLSLDSQMRLQTLDVSFNRLSHISPFILPNSIELLFMNDNLISSVEPHSFIHKTNLTRVDLYANQITTLDIKALRLLPVAENRPLPEFYIGGNPFLCDCNIDWLQKINQLTSRQYPKIMDLETIYCKLLNNRERTYISLLDAEPKNFLCAYKTHCFALCHCCDFDACDCEMTCPTNCTCFHDQGWSTNIVECSAVGYGEMPTNIPMDTTEVYIDGNNFTELSGHSFIGRKNLITLFANNSNIRAIYNTTFSSLKRLTILHLEDNHIDKLLGNEFVNLENLQELYMQNNGMMYIANATFLHMRRLEVLRLDGNMLVHFEVWQLMSNPYLIEIGLSGNLWSCECSYLSRLRNYLQQNADKVIDGNRVACVYNNVTSILRDKNGTKCTLREDISTYVRTSEIEDLLPLLLIATCTFVGFFGIVLGIFCYRHELRVWANSNSILSMCYKSDLIDTLEKEFVYDSFIAYSLQDDHFVSQILAHTLENDIGYQLSLHYRDSNVNAYIADAIIEAVESSKGIVVVLSKNFLYNEWTRFEYKSALHEIVKRRKRLIFILYGDLPQRDIDVDMRHYLKTNTCIEWDDKKFWQKLRMALPPIRTKRHNLPSRPNPVNIYATSTHDYRPATQAASCNTRYACGNYATINDCGRNCNKKNLDDMSSCKYNSLGGDKGIKNDLSIKSLQQRHHEYAVPANFIIDDFRVQHAGNYSKNKKSCTCYHPSEAAYNELLPCNNCSLNDCINSSLSNSMRSIQLNDNLDNVNDNLNMGGDSKPPSANDFSNCCKRSCNCNNGSNYSDEICRCISQTGGKYKSNWSLNEKHINQNIWS